MAYYRPFREEHCRTAKYEAQRQLSGITHYVDDDTLKYFKCRILDVIFSNDGLTLGLVMSQPNYEKNDKREYKVTLFNVFGSTGFINLVNNKLSDYGTPVISELNVVESEFYETKAEALNALNELSEHPLIKAWVKDSAESHKLQAASESKYIIDLL
tara:strand:+ start:129 stop:599 length:471 start_codon:yes stop_codon:yes gene_type:complete